MQHITIKIHEEELEITSEMIEYYKHISRRKRVTKKGVEKFFNSLLDKFNLQQLF